MRKYWTQAEIEYLREIYPGQDNGTIGETMNRSWSAIQNMAVKLGLKKSNSFMAGPMCRFQKGQAAWNHGVTGYMGANKTSFRKGNKPQTWRPVGSERMSKDGTFERKVADTGTKRDWRPVKDLIWEKENGPVPKGMFVVHKDRNRENFDPKNLELVNRAENMRRNTYHRYPKEIANLIQLRGALNRQLNKRSAHEKQAH